MADHLMKYWAWTRCALFMHVVKYERKKPPFVFHCKFACVIIIDNINHYSKCLYIYRVTLVWNFYWAHKFVARWIIYNCVYLYLWPFRFVAVLVCGRSGLWPFRFVAVLVCGRSGLWPFRFVAVSVCGRSGLWPFPLWPFWFVAV